MDSLWFLTGCIGFAWLVLWSIRDFSKPSKRFWPFDARWMAAAATKAAAGRWTRKPLPGASKQP